MSDFQRLQAEIEKTFRRFFGETPLNDRIKDILSQATAAGRFRDEAHLKAEIGDLLAAVLQLCTEQKWGPESLVVQALERISARSEIYTKLGRKLRIALMYGAFDPVHFGHLEAAKLVLRHAEVDEVWFMPCFESMHAPCRATAEQRLEMCRLACEGEDKIRVFEYAIEQRFRGERQHLIKKLLNEEIALNQCDFRVVIGQEFAETLYFWSNCEGFERLIPFLVLPRKECATPRPTAWYLAAPHKFLEAASQGAYQRAVEVRALLSRRERAAELSVPGDVLKFCYEHSIYDEIQKVSDSKARKIALFVDAFDPPTLVQRHQVQGLLQNGFDEVVIAPVGVLHTDADLMRSDPLHRASMVTLGFRNMEGVTIDYDDISLARYTPRCDLQKKYASNGEVWHVVQAGDLAQSSSQGKNSHLPLDWEDGSELWEKAHFAILGEIEGAIEDCQLPPNHVRLSIAESNKLKDLKELALRGENIGPYVFAPVADYLRRHRLFRTASRRRNNTQSLQQPGLKIVADHRNARSRELASQYARFESDSPDLILVLGGDGTMLHAIREHWRERIPFVGLNTGHLGFLMNERLPIDLCNLELVTYSLPLLRVDCIPATGAPFWGLAFSDVWLERAEGQAAWLRVDVDGETRVSKVVGDGMLIATAAGSSAYARAMGAVPVPLNTPTLTLAGSNIFQPRFWKPMALSDESSITLASIDTVGKRPVRGFIDGNAMGIVQEIHVRRSLTAGVELAFTKEFDPSSRLLRSLFPPAE